MKKGVLQKSWERCAGLGRKLADGYERDLDAATPLSMLTGHGKLVLSAPFSVVAEVIAEVACQSGRPVDKTVLKKPRL